MNRLWGNNIPYLNKEYGDFQPDITPYIVDDSDACVIVCAGGAYSMRATHESVNIAQWFNSIGMSAFVLDYRVYPYSNPAPISDAIRAVKHVRYNAKEYGINPDKIAIMGFSAGGHLAGSLSVHYDKTMYTSKDEIDEVSAKPNASILCYPVIDMFEYRHDGSRSNLLGQNPPHSDKEFMSLYKQVTKDTPQTFIWHTSSDSVVPVQNSLLYADALSKVKVPFEMHIYPIGAHGLGLATDIPHVAQWCESCENWLKLIEFLK